MLTPSNIKREKVDDDDKEENANKRRKTTNNEELVNSNNISNSINDNGNNISNINNDSYAQFGQSVANHLRESNLSKGQLLVLQGEILATIAKHVA